ncbi:hypothetical protein HPB48_010348 [Haemaphysalis longicornis]|uniref:Uncharacterized protein n=1 Tax=Haemaphysalis longicornis TaxID=44386 RepID=A0A9J6GTJ8_HAELO|nr:hypothetical protein HPB48_010348 [Haemaphysalis longicornis]
MDADISAIIADQPKKCQVFDLFRSGYLLATTGKAPKYAAPPYIKRVSGFGPGYVRLFFQTDRTIVLYTSLEMLFHAKYVCLPDPSTLHTLRVPFADYKNCYVVQHGKYNSDFHPWGFGQEQQMQEIQQQLVE